MLELVSPPEMNADGFLFLFATARLPLLENDGSTTFQASGKTLAGQARLLTKPI